MWLISSHPTAHFLFSMGTWREHTVGGAAPIRQQSSVCCPEVPPQLCTHGWFPSPRPLQIHPFLFTALHLTSHCYIRTMLLFTLQSHSPVWTEIVQIVQIEDVCSSALRHKALLPPEPLCLRQHAVRHLMGTPRLMGWMGTECWG